MKCGLLKKRLKRDSGAHSWIEGKLKTYCSNCSPKIENLSKLSEVMVVPITPKSFKLVMRKKVYSHPSNYGRKGGKNIAFYISSPKSSITHLAKVKLILKEKKQKIYFLEDIKKLIKPILRGKFAGIQGTQYTTLGKINNAQYIKELTKKEIKNDK